MIKILKSKISTALTDTSSKMYFLVSDIFAVFTVISITSLVLETVSSLQAYQIVFDFIEWLAVGVFTIEYIARLYVSKSSWRYAISFFGVIDLVSILPSLLGLGNLTFLKSARAIRLVRLLRMVRLAKLSKMKGKDVEEKMSFFTVNIILFLTTVVVSALLVGTLIYIVEGQNEAFASIPLGMFWSFKMFLLGLPIAEPETAGGQFVHIVGRLVGMIVFGVLVGVAGNVVQNYLFAKKS